MFKKIGTYIGTYIVLTAILALSAYLVQQYLVFQLAVLALVWFAFFGLEYAMNGGSIKQCLPQDILLFGFGGEQKRAEFAKKQLNPNVDTTISGSKRMWHSKDEHNEQDYIDCGNDILSTGAYFWFSKFIIPLAIALYLISRSL